jgi:hypothetical protein
MQLMKWINFCSFFINLAHAGILSDISKNAWELPDLNLGWVTGYS